MYMCMSEAVACLRNSTMTSTFYARYNERTTEVEAEDRYAAEQAAGAVFDIPEYQWRSINIVELGGEDDTDVHLYTDVNVELHNNRDDNLWNVEVIISDNEGVGPAEEVFASVYGDECVVHGAAIQIQGGTMNLENLTVELTTWQQDDLDDRSFRFVSAASPQELL